MRVATALFLLAAAASVGAHQAPNSLLRLDIRADAVHAECWVPVSELDFARAAEPGGDLAAYLLRHIAAETAAGARWRVAVEALRDATYLGHAYVVADLTLAPPAGASTGEFVLFDDAVTHEVRNHVVYVVARRGDASALIGALQYPARRLDVARMSNGTTTR
jgi:hypothetical protein